MRLTTVDSLTSVEALMALEEQLDGPLTNSIPALKAFLVTPFETQYTNSEATLRIWVFARHGSSVLFASFETASFGVGTLAEAARVVEAHHYPTIETAANNFLGAIKQAA